MSAPDKYFVDNVGQGDSVNYQAYRKIMTHLEYPGNPTNNVTPDFIGQECFDTVGSIMYKATGLAAANWAALHA